MILNEKQSDIVKLLNIGHYFSSSARYLPSEMKDYDRLYPEYYYIHLSNGKFLAYCDKILDEYFKDTV